MIEETKISLVCLFPKFSPSSLVEGVSEVSALLGFCFGEGSGTPLQYSCLESPMDGGAWWAAVHGVTKSRTRLSDFTFTFHFHALERKWQPTPQCSCLENPRDGGARWAAISGVAQSQTRLKQLSSSSSRLLLCPGPPCMLGCFSHARLCDLVGCVAHQALLSMGFSRQEY